MDGRAKSGGRKHTHGKEDNNNFSNNNGDADHSIRC